jgi:GLPGLI family protein
LILSLKTACVFIFALFNLNLYAQKEQTLYYEATCTYKIESAGPIDKGAEAFYKNTRFVLYLKGTWTRTDLNSSSGNTITLHDSKQQIGVIMNDYGNQKILVRMNQEELKDKNKQFDQKTIELKEDTRNILGYNCRLAIIKLSDGTEFRVYYAPDILFSNKQFDSPFHDLPGFPLEYEVMMGSMKFRYLATQISFDAVPSAMFDIPKSGYREMKYSESKN